MTDVFGLGHLCILIYRNITHIYDMYLTFTNVTPKNVQYTECYGGGADMCV